MTRHLLTAAAAACAISFGFVGFSPAYALSSKECSVKYQAAKGDGTLNGMKWNDFRKAQCGGVSAEAVPAAEAAEAVPAADSAGAPLKAAAAVETAGDQVKTATAAAASGTAVYPSVISPKYGTQTAGQQRMHTCLDQYNANKADGGNGGLRWIQKGGGYYSLCNKHLKGEV